MIIDRQEDVTEAVLRAMAGTPDARLRTIASAMVRHLHAFLREVRPSQQEFETGLDFLMQLGQATNAKHNEVVLFADVIGASTLVTLLNDGPVPTSALLGPFWRDGSPITENGASIVRSATPGAPLTVTGTVRDEHGAAIVGARVDIWHASPKGLYDNPDHAQADMNLRGTFATEADGRFWFTTVLPDGYPVPVHGPVGDLLRAQQRHPFRPAHLHFLIHKPGHRTLVTQVFVADDPHIGSDVVFGVTGALLGKYQAGDGAYTLAHDFILPTGEARLPKPPIA